MTVFSFSYRYVGADKPAPEVIVWDNAGDSMWSDKDEIRKPSTMSVTVDLTKKPTVDNI